MMKQFLEAQGLTYKEVNVQTDQKAAIRLVRETGQMGVPQTKVNGHWVLGFDPETLMSYVNKG
ncbi:glutaredoxin family protein [Neobacillus sp. Marseille-QA0830]